MSAEFSTQEADARRQGDPYLVYTDAAGSERVLSLLDSWTRVTIGRGMASDVPLSWDGGISTVHATLDKLGDDWVLIDEGLSKNGSYVNGELVEGRRRLIDGDTLLFGTTEIAFRAPFQVVDATAVTPRPA